MNPSNDDPTAGQTPATCPFCQSSKVVTASEKLDASTYWRCEACGQVWNVGRLRAAGRYRYGGR
jgi:transposase-like protein